MALRTGQFLLTPYLILDAPTSTPKVCPRNIALPITKVIHGMVDRIAIASDLKLQSQCQFTHAGRLPGTVEPPARCASEMFLIA